MTPFLRLAIANDLYVSAWEIKKAALKCQHPDWFITSARLANPRNLRKAENYEQWKFLI